MNLEEFCKKVGRSENTVKKNWLRTKENLAKKGIIATRVGSGDNAEYYISYKPM